MWYYYRLSAKIRNAKTFLNYCEEIAEKLRRQTYNGKPIEVVVDQRDINAGEKGWQWVKKGIPIRVEVGPRDMEKNSVFVARRDKSGKEKYGQDKDDFVSAAPKVLDEIQNGLLQRARTFCEDNTREIDNYADFTAFFTPANKEKPEIHGGFARSHLCDNPACEEKN